MEQSISVIIPAYNEEENIKLCVEESLKEVGEITPDYEILVVDDASKDKTGEILDELADKYEQVRVIHHEKNMATAGALKTLFKNAKKDILFYIPGDRQCRIFEIHKYLDVIDKYDIIFGWRVNRADPWYRILFNKAYHLALRVLFGVKIHDVEGSSMWKKKVFEDVGMDAQGAFVLTEVMLQATKKGYKAGEVKTIHYPREAGKQTGVHPKEILRNITDVLKLWKRLRK